ncbi:hypothetical protein K458DRAFT_422257 [Lentithecium fluviatile CBS 122367]|uniref:Uncharacterized protein n=1 Tax=Lentithecium fluviatile CBS 122367 TaxID=1168545 RepID=A0A6G1IN75_9PLEO|nr:hypothetical protein K458DRAFT_422257 [Lentithecium fluviatile CBS 122367]
MSFITIAAPENLQLQSPLVRLPTEIRNIIYSYCFAADGPIVDPVVGCNRPEGETFPKLGVNVLQTCRRIYHEADRRPLIAQNTFRFTTVDRVRCFLQSLGNEYSDLVEDIEIDARRVHSDHPSIGREWLQYLAWGGGNWGKILGSLCVDAPGLKCLRLNFQSWPSIPMFRTELWNLLRAMLWHVEGLERVIVVGASKGAGMAKREPWSPVHFVGGDDVGSGDLVEHMWNTVRDSNKLGKVIRWERREGRLYLEVVSRAYLVKNVNKKWAGPCTRENYTDPWPENGSCTWFGYQNRNSDVIEPSTKGVNPSGAG